MFTSFRPQRLAKDLKTRFMVSFVVRYQMCVGIKIRADENIQGTSSAHENQ